ncbi:CORD and CS domain-containing protein [Blastomyces gilchristii SLH14081]|uniref:CORD and CS domain-containing protein n=1 Tax=Blastomyces gilchristii (strain SLH14081) TaxID=559298 RepID=A0A179U858_BLAGS|nr:CORD and CS domain-containing protein [Blastomyces gilchristii SLH14081]OAT03498.1 CORD and CS domain-containing protein [Blastomyces gilchristii SLH14081]
MAQKCVHKGCGKVFTDPDEPCTYHPGPPEFHEGHKGWKCCKPRVLSFDEFLTIPPCTTGKHSAVDDTPAPEPQKETPQAAPDTTPKHTPIAIGNIPTTLSAAGVHTPTPTTSPPPESESDDPSLAIKAGATCRRRGCNAKYSPSVSRDDEKCVHHPGQPIFHEGSKGWSCCKRRVLEFDEFMKIIGCKERARHLFLGKGKKSGEEKVDNIRTDFYQTATSIMATLYLKKIDKASAKVNFSSPTTIELDLPTADNKRFKETFNLYAPIDVEKSSFQIMGTKMDLNLAKADGTSWPVLRKDDKHTGEIIQIGRAKKA